MSYALALNRLNQKVFSHSHHFICQKLDSHRCEIFLKFHFIKARVINLFFEDSLFPLLGLYFLQGLTRHIVDVDMLLQVNEIGVSSVPLQLHPQKEILLRDVVCLHH